MRPYKFSGIVYTIIIASILTTTVAISPMNFLQINNASAQQPTNPSAQQPTNPSAQQPTNPSAQQPTNPSAQQPTNPSAQQPTNPSATAQSSNATQANSGMNPNSAVNSSSMNQSGGLAGSISIFSPIVNAFKSAIHVSLSSAITNAQNTLGNNSTTLAAFIHPDKGFIVYQIFALDANNNIHKIVVDPGNGNILSSQQMSLIEMMLMLHGGMMMGPGMDNGMMSHGMMGPGMDNGMMSHGMMGPGMDNGMMSHGMMGPGMDNGMMSHGMMGPGMGMNKPLH